MAMTSIGKSYNIAILLKRSIGIAIAITFATSIAIIAGIVIVLSNISYNPDSHKKPAVWKMEDL
jgi:hypothetical protein